MRRREAGFFLRGRMREFAFERNNLRGVCLGLGLGLVVYVVFPQLIGYKWGIASLLGLLIAFYITNCKIERSSSEWSVGKLEIGEAAETRVGQTIEYSITSENCAVAHSVTEIAKVGDIDHLVATPVAVWVIESKYRKVPKKKFAKVLSRIAANTDAVRQWAPAGTTVRGCLVLAYESKLSKRNYSHRKEQILAYTPDRLQKEIEREVRAARSIDEDVANAVWELGKIVE